MKKLKYLLIPLFSLLFIVNVNAASIDTKYTMPSYTDAQKVLIEEFKNSTEYNQILEYIENSMTNVFINGSIGYVDFTDNYLLIFDTDTFLNNTIIVDFVKSFNNIPYNIYQSNGSDYGEFSLFTNGSINSFRYNFTFSNDLLSNVSLYTNGRFSYNFINMLENITTGDNYISYPDHYYFDTTYYTGYSDTINYGYDNGRFAVNIPIKLEDDVLYTPPTSFDNNVFIDSISLPFTNVEPTYSYTSTILDNGNVKLDFTFTNYTSGSGYAFEIENSVNNEEYGITNTYSNIFPNQIPFGSSYSIELSYDSLLYVTLAKYEQVEQTSLYSREEIYTNIIDINNVVFENVKDPYFVIYTQNKNNITGTFVNTTNQMTCWYSYSDTQTEDYLPCDEEVGFNVHDNGYVEVIIKKGNEIIYSRKINYIGANDNEPYITYQINKKDFYSIVVWGIENELSNTTYRYSTNNGASYTNWTTYNNTNNIINVFDNSTIIIEIANNNQSTIYDSKAIVVVNDITTIKDINNTTINIINKFKNIFSVNPKILQNISSYYEAIRTSKIYLIIFIPFLTSLICAIIYLIRRK